MADWAGVDTFESYAVGGLNGGNGGSGWSGAWSTDGGITVVSSPAEGGSTRAAKVNSITGGDGSRTLTSSATTGILRVYMYATNVPTGTKGFYPAILRDGTTLEFVIGWGTNATHSNGNTIAFGDNASSWVTLSTTASAATWYYVDVQFDQANNRARASFNGGAWSSYVTAAGGTYAQITNYRITSADGNASDQGYHIDSIGVGTGPAAATTNAAFLLNFV